MKITNVRACQPYCESSPPDWRTDLGQILIAVDTDAGLTGYGVGGGGFASIHVVQTVLRDMLLGLDPLEIETLWERMYRRTLAYGQKGLVLMAISGVDLALWDLKGRAESLPVSELLGGRRHERLPTYVTVWNDGQLREVAGRGHRGYKLHLEAMVGGESDQSSDAAAADFVDRVESRVAAARELLGHEVELMADAWMQWSLPTALSVAERLAPYHLSWLEEPLPIDDLAGYRELVDKSPLPIAGGEHEYTAAAFEHLASERLHEVLQPDVCWCGGLTQLVRIYEIGAEHGLRVCPHRGAELWSLHALAALDPQPLAESGRGWMTWVKGQPEMEGGEIAVPDSPGIGIHVDEDRLAVLPAPANHWTARAR
ncbi:MAG: mandelate racemase/muconate lactonizing enzyme family protein [Planctomycetales bacterium]|nr:mandelate racemase/muconate lactonizing enzyme family protein [Planctomycetales bacterium]